MSWLCRIGLHRRVYRPFWEHRIVDGPPRQFTLVTCTRCGERHESRDSTDLERALRQASKE
jgi:hypothetical protein